LKQERDEWGTDFVARFRWNDKMSTLGNHRTSVSTLMGVAVFAADGKALGVCASLRWLL